MVGIGAKKVNVVTVCSRKGARKEPTCRDREKGWFVNQCRKQKWELMAWE